MKIGLLAILILGGLAVLSIFLFGPNMSQEPQSNIAPTESETPEQSISLEEMVGRMLIVGFRGADAPENSYVAKVIQDVKPGSLILFDRDLPSGNTFPRNITSPAQTRALITELKSYANYPLLISVDAEGGRVNRLKPSYGFIQMPSHAELGDGTTENTYIVASRLAKQLKDLGIALNFAPVVDVNVDPQSAAIGALDRSFSDDSNSVYAHADAFVRAHEENNVQTALKHFPGHGSARGDTHLGIVDVTNSWTEEELVPYRKLIDGGYMGAIMTAHVIDRNLSPLPATLSKEILTDLLREDLGFKGVIITDDMHMAAIISQYGIEEASIRAIEAGADMIIISNNVSVYDEQAPYKVLDAIVKAVKDGRISEARIKESYARIQNFY